MSNHPAAPPVVAVTVAAGGVGPSWPAASSAISGCRTSVLRPAAASSTCATCPPSRNHSRESTASSTLGALQTEAPFEDILDHNLRAGYDIFEAAPRKGLPRIVFASINRPTGMYPRSDRIGPEHPIQPDTHYGVSKPFGEATARLYAEKWGVSAVCIRIGTCIERPLDRHHLSTWLSPRDNAEAFAAEVADDPSEPAGTQGGLFTAIDFTPLKA